MRKGPGFPPEAFHFHSDQPARDDQRAATPEGLTIEEQPCFY